MTTNATVPPRLLTVDEVAERLRINRATAYRLIHEQVLSPGLGAQREETDHD